MSVHQNLKLYTLDKLCAIQPVPSTSSNPSPFLTISKENGEVQILATLDVSKATSSLDIYGILGVITLHSGDYLIVITSKKRIATLFPGLDHEVYTITDTKIIPVSIKKHTLSRTEKSQEKHFIKLLESICNMGHMYFSYSFDLTHSAQRSFTQSSKLPLWKSADKRFLWNRHLLSKFMDLAQTKLPELNNFILPILCGFVKTITSTINHQKFHYTLITRKHTQRVGTRYHSRGIDERGNVSNFIETEQILSLHVASQMITHVRSFVQIRGSIPLFWSQRINSKYTPLLEIYRKPNSTEVFLKHCNDQCQLYGDSLTMVNLINKKGYELPLGEEFRSQVEQVNDKRLNYIHFDFHKECKKMRYDRVSLLIDSLLPVLDKQGHFSCSISQGNEVTQVHRTQTGVIRTNCIDCLDRTNVVQSAIAKHVLLQQLQAFHILSSTSKSTTPTTQGTATLTLPYDFQLQFNHVWADHADVVSFLYSGTNALKTDFTRFGQRTFQGALKDLQSSLRRYYINNFRDGQRQDAFDLFLGVYDVEKHASLNFTTSKFLGPLLHSIFVYSVGLSMLIMFVSVVMSSTSFSQSIQWLFTLIFFLLLCVWLVIHMYGEALVQRPSFVPMTSSVSQERRDHLKKKE